MCALVGAPSAPTNAHINTNSLMFLVPVMLTRIERCGTVTHRSKLNMPALPGRVVNSLHNIEDMIGLCTASTMGPTRTHRMRHISQTDATRIFGPAMRQRHIAPGPLLRPVDRYWSPKSIRVRDTQRPRRSINLDTWSMMRPHIKASHNRSYRSAGKIEQASNMCRRFYLNLCAILGLTGNRTLRER